MAHDDYATGPMRGLEKDLPAGEQVLWQGAPQTWALAKSALSLHWVLGYFALLAVWRGLALGMQGSISAGLRAALWYGLAGLAAGGLLLLVAWVFARATVYTITTGRVVLRIGAALTLSINLPLNRLSYLVLWPRARPWGLRAPEPTLRCIPNVAEVAAILGRAAEARVDDITCEIETGAAPVPAE